MKFEQQEDRSFKLTGTVAEITKVCDELTNAWDGDDEVVIGLTEVIAGRDDDSQEQAEYAFDQSAIGDAVDVLENAQDDEVRQAAEQARDAMDAHNARVTEEAERAASGE